MIKKLIILSLTLLLISCGEDEEETTAETTTETDVVSEEQLAEVEVSELDEETDFEELDSTYEEEELTEENSFLVYNGYSKTLTVHSDPSFFQILPLKEYIFLSSGDCVRIHNQHLDNIAIRSTFSSFSPIAFTSICQELNCPRGDISIGDKRDSDGDLVPFVKSLKKGQNINCKRTRELEDLV